MSFRVARQVRVIQSSFGLGSWLEPTPTVQTEKRRTTMRCALYPTRKRVLLWTTALIVSSTGMLHAGTLTVSAMANIFGAGLAAPPPGPLGNGIVPPFTAITAGNILTFTSVTGSASFGGSIFCAPDGCPAGVDGNTGTNMNPQGGISGIIDDDGVFFLTGVFLTDSPPVAPPPPTLSFTGNQNFTDLSPQIGQVFFVGDGLTNLAQTQIFQIPSGATRLFLGFADGNSFQGDPEFYQDNVGSLTAQFVVSPEPTSLILAATALLGLAIARRSNGRSS